ncbi:TIGR03086 family metal-binding protein [Sphaerisporangium sp. TRM90804]|uniref:TIGR03086 family metal-binding protein n=1 Tax=Sphaerisporangium sp. TRM90804 TaxID=3031113 RepID=UPI00244A0377|nr:TIGR03086 family metal-binding protein [Sphaerisporangium sp. TRM90804]MDH2428181.1 TIGR03086 family metal-binding protein [Sphaerisporangium sp. TRM90804]
MPRLLAKASVGTSAVVRGIEPASFGEPTPCAKYDVRALLNHLFGVIVMFHSLARKEEVPEGLLQADHLHGDWATGFEKATERLVELWSDPEAYEGVTPTLGVPASIAAQMALIDLVVHGWDLSRATGLPYTVDDELVRAVTALMERMGDQARQMGVFGAAVPVPETAPAFDRALGLSGRDPRWSPPA